jgi:pimeloyl-ACP methyl ester carboxylesterase
MLTLVLANGSALVARSLEDCAPWSRTDVLQDEETRFPSERYVAATAHRSTEYFGDAVVRAFGSTTPPPSLSLLHHAEAPSEQQHETPVLLLHGVGGDATLAWHAVNMGGEKGLVPYLVERGHRVFALTFAVSHGSSVSHAVHVAHALERVRELTGAAQVDVVAHSMGGLAARAYLTRVDRLIPRYRNDVRRLVLLGTPNLGLDLSFRHPRAYQWFSAYGFPSPWLRHEGRDVSGESMFGGAYRGHLEMAHDQSGTHPLSGVEPHAEQTYRGRDFEGARCPGLAAAVERGGRFMQKLNARRTPRKVGVYLLAGDDNVLRYWDLSGKPRTQIGEYDAPSDGLVFVSSVLGLSAKKASVRATRTLHTTHFELTYVEPGKEQVAEWLAGTAAER